MRMKSLKTMLATLLIAASTLLSPSTALADDINLTPNGYFYLYQSRDYAGAKCQWSGNSSQHYPAGCSSWYYYSLANRGWTGSYAAVNLYIYENYGGAYACVGKATGWNDLYYKYYTWGTGGGKNSRIGGNGGNSHTWVQSCP